ncbi:hypothetical protein Lalb_Chr23g0268121 [Lupinus albus]|uniref:Uncharacterized protein n=1 Tax=Lupinus albus TaxID=3870 RepID=A0A6A4MUD8_LUPAL|nr:hypothetical protein Lalb_Chr23g0268121 [Lupinus albus]
MFFNNFEHDKLTNDSFFSNNVIVEKNQSSLIELHDETVRMKTAMKLVMHDMNKIKKEVKTQSTLMWSKLPFV